MKITTINFDLHGDSRGSLVAIEEHKNIPFDVKRVYYIFGTKPDVRRGCHAHKNLQQVAICVKGSCKFLLDDGKDRYDFELNTPYLGLYIEGTIWREMYDFSDDCVLLVLADDYHSPEDYIRDYDAFLQAVNT